MLERLTVSQWGLTWVAAGANPRGWELDEPA